MNSLERLKQKFPVRLLPNEISSSKYEIKNTQEAEQLKDILSKKSKYNKRLIKIINENIMNGNITITNETIYEDLSEWLTVEESEYFMNKEYANVVDDLVTYQVPLGEKDKYAQIFIKEQRELLASHGTTGFRTWEAAMVFFYYVTSVNPDIINEIAHSKKALELGCGTGFLGIFLSKILRNTQFCLTDGSNLVVDLCKENIQLNDVDNRSIDCKELLWGHQDDTKSEKYDFIFGADITFDNDKGVCLISATIRNEDTIKTLPKWNLEKIYEINNSFCDNEKDLSQRDQFVKKYWFEDLLADDTKNYKFLMNTIPADSKPTEQVTPVKNSPLGKNEFKDHMNNIKSCIDENRSLKEDCKKLINSYTSLQADLLKLSNEMSNLTSSFLKLDTLEKANNTLQEKVDQQKSLIDKQKEMMDRSDRETNKTVGELKKQVLDLQKENTRKTLINEKEYKLICEAEEKRKNAELMRVKNEQSRNASEKTRSANDKSRKANEEQIKELKKLLQIKISESTQVNSHLQENESNREEAEKRREEHESNRTKNESERANAVINSSELLSKKLAEIELKIKDIIENDSRQTYESYAIDKIEKPNLTKETEFKANTIEISGIIDEVQLSFPEEVDSALPLAKQEFEVAEASKPADTPLC
ncbi:hypothetical protein ACO0OL_001531 [Hanseniaspora opuntiae]